MNWPLNDPTFTNIELILQVAVRVKSVDSSAVDYNFESSSIHHSEVMLC